MKKICLLSILLFGLFNIYSQTQITLTFMGQDSISQNPITLDSVYVKNLTEDCDTLLYGPVPVLSLLADWPEGIGEVSRDNQEEFILKQNYPNPFQGSTIVSIYRAYRGPLNLLLYTVTGTKLAEYHGEFEKGIQSFEILSSVNTVLILVASDDENHRSIKIVCYGQGNKGNNIRLLGQIQDQQFEKSTPAIPDNTGFIFYLGNEMTYTAYASGYDTSVLYDNPVSSETYTFAMQPVETSTIPSVTTSPVTDITQTTATSGGNVTSDGGEQVTARGVCWNIQPGPTTVNEHTTNGSGTGSFISNLTWLNPNTPYYIRAYATNSVGTAYGDELTFSTLVAELPTVTTTPASNITPTTATSGGNVTSDGGDFVSARGVCWSTLPNPALTDSHTLDGGGTGSFESYLSGLTSNTLYYIRAYATNSVGTAYGDELTFATLPVNLPTVTTAEVTNIAPTSATSGGNVTSDGGANVTARGVCWSTSPNPTTADSHTIDGSGTGTFVSNLTGLTPLTLYYVRAYATNSVGTAYGNEVTFTTLAPFTCGQAVTYEGQTYNTIQIGTQCWFQENLNVGTKINGSQNQSNNSIIEKYCYNDLESNCDVYGGLYQWNEMMQYSTTPGVQGICPTGWHLPTDAEWTTLTDYLGGENVAGGKMKEAGTAHWLPPNTGATNSSGFTALPGGDRNGNGSFSSLTSLAYFWSSTEYSSSNAWDRALGSNMVNVDHYNDVKTYGFSARCVHD